MNSVKTENLHLNRISDFDPKSNFATKYENSRIFNVENENQKQENENLSIEQNDNEYQKTFLCAIAPVLLCAQFFGVMPLQGLKSTRPSKDLKFNYCCPQFYLAFIILFSDLTVIILYVKYFQKLGLQVGNLVTMVFFTVSFTSLLCFVILARKWPKVIRQWTILELKFLQKPYHNKNDEKKLKLQIRLTALIISILGIVEHGMFHLSTMYSFVERIHKCKIETDDIIKYYYTNDKGFVFDFLPYHIVIGLMTHLCSLISTVTWNFMDMIIILASIGINFRFQQFNTYIQKVTDANLSHSELFYENLRLDFIQLCDLLQYIDEQLSVIILLSCFNNLYFICYQLMNVFKTLRYGVDYAYFYYSTLYLLARTIFLFISAANINQSSLQPVNVFRYIKNSNEVDRFLFQINNEIIALSGMGFFHFTRKLLLSMIGTIVTFELVMIQFQWSDNQKNELSPLCS